MKKLVLLALACGAGLVAFSRRKAPLHDHEISATKTLADIFDENWPEDKHLFLAVKDI